MEPQPNQRTTWFIAIGGLLLMVMLVIIILAVLRSRRISAPVDLPAATTPQPTQITRFTPTPSLTPTFTPTATPSPTATFTPTPVGDIYLFTLPDGKTVPMVMIPAGDFLMGSTDADSMAIDDEKPQQRLTLDTYFIDQLEVTNAQFAAFVTNVGYQTTAELAGRGRVCLANGCQESVGATWHHPQGPASTLDGLAQHPVVQVSWLDANAYCQWRNAALPTEAQWEKAARGPNATSYPWGNGFVGQNLNFCDVNCLANWADLSLNDGFALTAPVGSYPNGVGLYGPLDMAGNVREWVADWYGVYGNPAGTTTAEERVIRGGSWFNGSNLVRSAGRNFAPPNQQSNEIGFRCVIDQTSPLYPPPPNP